MAAIRIPPAEPVLAWTPCALCWGQRIIFENRNGEGLVPCTCPRCLGIGEELRSAA